MLPGNTVSVVRQTIQMNQFNSLIVSDLAGHASKRSLARKHCFVTVLEKKYPQPLVVTSIELSGGLPAKSPGREMVSEMVSGKNYQISQVLPHQTLPAPRHAPHRVVRERYPKKENRNPQIPEISPK